MPAPKILPSTISKGTKFSVGADIYEFISAGIKSNMASFYGSLIVYCGDVKHLLSGQVLTGYYAQAHQIDWDSTTQVEEEDIDSCEDKKIELKYCLWCNDLLGSNQESPYCAVGKVYCKEYYFALKERMKIDFREPSEALDSEKESVVRWVKNFLKIK